MARWLFAAALAGAALTNRSQSAGPSLAQLLTFENSRAGSAPVGWSGGPPGTIFADDKIVHSGKLSARIERDASSPYNFSSMTAFIPMDFAGTTIEMRGYLRTENVTGIAGLWMREDGDSPGLAFDNMQKQQLKGTHDWAEYSIQLPIMPEARTLFFGVLVGGTGKAWADDLELLVDGKPVSEAPKVERPNTALESDREFDGGSHVALTALTTVQVRNLAVLGKVWGFLKYHHPQVVSGMRHWDYDLFRVLPAVAAAPDARTANSAMLRWIDDLGAIKDCTQCARLDETDLHLHPDLDWISDGAALGPQLSRRLRSIYINRLPGAKQFYLSLAPGVRNPVFEHERSYDKVKLPDAGFQLIGIYRLWNIVRYWYPYRDVVGEDWDRVLVEFIPRVALAKSADQYTLETMALVARIHDTHANLWSSLQLRPPAGECQVPVIVRFVENQAVVAGYSGAAGEATGLKMGDVITDVDGLAVPTLVQKWAPYYAASNEPTRLRDIARSLTRGACTDTKLRVRRSDAIAEITARRTPIDPRAGSTHDLPGDTFRLLSDKVAYLKLSSVKLADAPSYVDRAAATRGLIIDIRNYPSEFVVFGLGQLLVDRATPFVLFTRAELANPGAFRWGQPLSLTPQSPHYSGKVVILVDETTLSSAEYTAMAFRTAPQAIVVGSTTAGADGNVSQFALPGGLRTMISGIGVFYPDKKPTQRVGIAPDVEVKPTIAGIRAHRDEVLEEALRQILGPEVPAAEIQKLASPQAEGEPL